MTFRKWLWLLVHSGGLLAIGVTGLSCCCRCPSSAQARAPAPAHKPGRERPPQVVAGSYEMHWAGSAWQVILSADGNYQAVCGPTHYVGSWSWCGKQRVLLINERHAREQAPGEAAPPWTTWLVRLPAAAADSLTGDAAELASNEQQQQQQQQQPPRTVSPVSFKRQVIINRKGEGGNRVERQQ